MRSGVAGEIAARRNPSGAAIKVTFDIALKKGGLWATRVRTAAEKASVAPKRRGKPFGSGKKKSAKR
jgi:hypothetical protein